MSCKLSELPKITTKTDICPDCGQPAVEDKNGLKICGNCGEVV